MSSDYSRYFSKTIALVRQIRRLEENIEELNTYHAHFLNKARLALEQPGPISRWCRICLDQCHSALELCIQNHVSRRDLLNELPDTFAGELLEMGLLDEGDDNDASSQTSDSDSSN